MRSTKHHYLLSGELEHKENYQLTENISIHLAKKEVTNLRERNPQIGVVEALMDGNPLDLAIGDRVVVHHFTFYRDIASDKGYELQPHVLHGDKRLFKAPHGRFMFKLIDNAPVMLNNTLMVSKSVVEDYRLGLYMGDKTVVSVTHGNSRVPKGTEILTEPHALYQIEFDRDEHYKIFENEVVATVVGDTVVPYDDTIVVEDLELAHQQLVLVAKPSFGYAVVKDKAPGVTEVSVGDVVYYWPQQGLRHEKQNLITINNIIGICQDTSSLKLANHGNQ